MDAEHIQAITAIRRAEQKEMRRYMEYSECLMEFLERALDDPAPQRCGKCVNCAPNSFQFARCDEELLRKAALFLKNSTFAEP